MKRNQHHSQIVVLDQCSGVLAGAPRGLSLQAVNFCTQIELHKRIRHGRGVWTVMRLMIDGVRHSSSILGSCAGVK